MLDHLGRDIHCLRISVTDRCNLRCRYCMPEQENDCLSCHEMLSSEQLVRLTGLLAQLGIDKVRLTGGEPLVRPDLSSLIRMLRKVDGICTLALTTNGILLKEQLPALAEAGLNEVNISLDTLDRVQYAEITRRDELPNALAGLRAAIETPRLSVKVNCVPIGENDEQLVPLAMLARDKDVMVRFIEIMPIGLGASFPRRTERQVLERLEHAFGPARPVETSGRAGPAHYVMFPGFRSRVGFISALSRRFCSSCNRVRLTAAGFLKTCLQYEKGIDLKPLLNSGAEDATVLKAIGEAIWEKPQGHHFDTPAMEGDERRNMNKIGG